MTTTLTNFDSALKQLYSDKNVANTTLKRRPMLGAIAKNDKFGGRNMPIINQYGDSQGRSSSFAKAQANISGLGIEDFLLTRVSNYSLARVTGEAAEASKGDKVAFLSAMKSTIDGAMNSLANNLETQICRDGTGSMARIGSVATSAPFSQVTLTEEEDIIQFEVNQKVLFSVAKGGLLRSATALNVSAVNRSTGTVTFTETESPVAPATALTASTCALGLVGGVANDYVYTEGDTNATTAVAQTSALGISGFEAWVPAGTPSSGESFFSVDRSTDSRLYGQYYDGSGGTRESSLIHGASVSARIGGSPDVCFINHVQMRGLVTELGGKQQYSSVNAVTHKGQVADIGYRSIAVQGDNGVVNIVAANKCQPEIGWMLEMKTWMLHTLGAPTKFLMLDNSRILRVATDDSYEVRLGFRGNVACTSPMNNVHIALPDM